MRRWSAHSITCKTAGLIVGFTPKAGCSFVAKIFFNNTEGHDPAEFSTWPHPYRIAYQKQNPTMIHDWWKTDMDTIKFVRNPFARAVSSYFQAMRTHLREVIKESLCVNTVDWSFEQYLTWLSTTRLDFVNPHFGTQKFWGEGILFRYQNILKIEEVGDEIVLASGRRLEVASSLRSSAHHVRREVVAGYCGSLPFSGLADETSTFPDWKNFYNDRTKTLVAELYKKDFLAYGYSSVDIS